METKRIVYLDGLKGVGCVVVYLTHFVFAFYYGMYHFEPEACHLPGNLDIAIGKSPLNLLFNGNTAVRLFLAVSGYLLCLGYFRTGDRGRILSSAKRRYLRLMPPILAVNLLIYFAMKLGLYYNGQAAVLAGSEKWFAGFNAFPASFLRMLWESLFGCFLFGDNDYNGVLWTMRMLFLGAYLVFAAAYFIGKKCWRWMVYACLAVFLLRTDYIGIFLGYVLCDFMHQDWAWKKRLCACAPLNWLCAVAGLYLMAYPSSGFGYEGTLWAPLGALVFVNYYHILGVLLFVFAVLNLEALQRFFSAKPFLYLARISYALYLVHFLVIATLGAWFLLRAEPLLGYNLACFMDFGLITIVTVGLSELLERYMKVSVYPWKRLFRR